MVDKFRKKVFTTSFLIALIATLSAPETEAEELCLPETDTSNRQTEKTAPPSDALSPGDTYIFFDATPNMRGFLSADVQKQPPVITYRDIVSEVPHSLAGISQNVGYQKISTKLSTMTTEDVDLVGDSQFYKCPKGVPKNNCNNTKTSFIKSRVKRVLKIAAREPASSFIVLATDLFIEQSLLLDDNPGSIKGSLKTIMESGRSIGLVSLKVPFSGTIWDLPSGRSYEDAHSRPVFLLVVGAHNKIIKFFDALQKKKGINSGENVNFLIFTNQVIQNPLTEDTWSEQAFKDQGGFVPDKLWGTGANFQQFRVARKNQGALAAINITEIQTQNTLPITKFEVKSQVWQWNGRADSCEKRWFEFRYKNGKMIDVSREGTKFNFQLAGPKSISGKLPKRKKYFIHTEVKATDIAVDKELTSWVNEWSFNENGEDNLYQNKAKFFPSLNLERFVDHLETVTQKTFDPQVIARFNIGVLLER